MIIKQLNANVVITNKVGNKADVLNVVKNAEAKVIKLTSSPKELEYELAA